MATSYKGRSGSSRSTWARYSGSGWGSSSNWGRSDSSSAKSSATKARKTSSSASYSSSQYRNVTNTLAKRIDSYRTVMAQAQGSGKFGRPSPSMLNSFANWINKGAVVQMVSAAQVARWARVQGQRFNSQSPSIAACKTVLSHKFSRSLIKAVCLTKNGQFMVATSATHNGRAFSFPR